MQHKTYCLMNN